MTMTGLRLVLVRSVKGTGTRTMSRCSGIVPVLVVKGIVPEIENAGRGGHQIARLVFFGQEDDDIHRGSRGNRNGNVQFSVRGNCCREGESTRHVTSRLGRMGPF